MAVNANVARSNELVRGLPQRGPLVLQTLRDRALGVMIGSALGDAIGLYTEFMTTREVIARYSAKPTFTLHPAPSPQFWGDNHRANHPEGNWSDDTDHAIILLLAFLRTARTDDTNPEGQIAFSLTLPLPAQTEVALRIRLWIKNGTMALGRFPIGAGRHTRDINKRRNFVRAPPVAAKDEWVASGYRSAPNGALMRTHPLGIMTVFRTEAEAFHIGAEVSKASHYDPRCVVSCIIGTALVRAVVRGEIIVEADIDNLINRAVTWYIANESDPDALTRFNRAELNKHVNPPNGFNDLNLDTNANEVGYTYKCLGSGIECLRLAIRIDERSRGGLVAREMLFEWLIHELTMRAGDADTNGCFAGALLGGYCGWSGLPGHWKHGLIDGVWLQQKSEDLCTVLGFRSGTYNGATDPQVKRYGGRANVYSAAELAARASAHWASCATRLATRSK
ncbi:ADP-ribosylglycohydrolase-domain-containing protein [Cladorrhinum sp. PSN332]|nr:ADP-ribosylglycohydrolase-domain-containing protein [Cladorrhinum sp. PSN332]